MYIVGNGARKQRPRPGPVAVLRICAYLAPFPYRRILPLTAATRPFPLSCASSAPFHDISGLAARSRCDSQPSTHNACHPARASWIQPTPYRPGFRLAGGLRADNMYVVRRQQAIYSHSSHAADALSILFHDTTLHANTAPPARDAPRSILSAIRPISSDPRYCSPVPAPAQTCLRPGSRVRGVRCTALHARSCQ